MTRPQCRECARGAVDSAAHDRVVHATRTWEYPSEGLDASEITAAVIEPAERDSGAMARQPLRAEGSEHQAVSSPGGTGHEKWWTRTWEENSTELLTTGTRKMGSGGWAKQRERDHSQ